MKKALRRKMRSVLRTLSTEIRHQKAMAACRHLLASDAWQRAGTVFVYLSMEHELDTTPLIEACWRDHKRAFAEQIVDTLVVEPHDQPVHMLVTDAGPLAWS